jgi:PBSX family phage portal protein
MQKTARVDFVGENIQKTESRQIENPFRGIDGVINPPDYLNFDRLLELYQSSEVYYRAVNVKAQYAVGLGWKLVDTDSNGTTEDRERVLNFFENCNPELSFSELLNHVMVDLECLGNSYLEVTRDSFGRIAKLFHMPAQTVRLKRDGGFVQMRGGKKREFARFGAEEIPLDEKSGTPLSEVIHFAKYNPASSFYGLPDAVPAIGSTMGDLMARDYNVTFFENNATPQYCLMISGGTLSDKDKEDLTAYLSDIKGNPHKTMVLQFPQGITGELKAISVSPKDASFGDYRRMNRDLMVVAHGVPPHLLGIIESGNLGGGTGETQLTNFKNLVITPRQRFLADRITRLIIRMGLGVSGWNFVFNELDVEDEFKIAQTDKIFIEAGVLKVDEVRKRMGLD